MKQQVILILKKPTKMVPGCHGNHKYSLLQQKQAQHAGNNIYENKSSIYVQIFHVKSEG